jgi:aspartyl-tRNA(Asn)/glutamyl-tRNA(Gln) amidotransferase subunit C
MQVNDVLLDKLADLARLEIEPAEREGLKQDLQKMISFVEKLQELDTAGAGPQLHMTDAMNVLREDVVQGSVTREEGLKNAPDTDGMFFKVPKVIKKVGG